MKRVAVGKFDEGAVPRAKHFWTRSASDYKNEINKRYKRMTQDELADLVVQSRTSDESRNRCIEQIIDALGPLIMRMALQFSKEDNYMDYAQEAAIAVIDCVDKFDVCHESGSTFVTYCVASIASRFNHKSDELDGVVSNGSATRTEKIKLRNFYDRYVKDNGVPPSKKELEEECAKMGFPYVEGLMITNGAFASIDEPSKRNDDESEMHTMNIVDQMEQDKNLSPELWVDGYDTSTLLDILRDRYSNHSRHRKKDTLNGISSRNIDILFAYYGIQRDVPETVDTLALKYNMSRQAIQQIVEKTILDIRNMSKDLVDDKII